ncbi:MAG: hypothetical protein ACQETE_03955 [Bacteroidota bacterium]
MSNYKFKYYNINVLSYEYHDIDYSVEQLLNEVEIGFESGFRFHKEDDYLAFDLEVDLTSRIPRDGGKKDHSLLSIKTENIFEVQGISDVDKEQFMEQEKNFLTTLASISYSSLRGLLVEKIANTRIAGKFLLPIVNPRNFVETESK